MFFLISSLKFLCYVAVVLMLMFWLLFKILFVYILSVKWSQQVIYCEARLRIKALGEKKLLRIVKKQIKNSETGRMIKADESDGRITDDSDGCHGPLWQTQMGHVWNHLNDKWCTVLNHKPIVAFTELFFTSIVFSVFSVVFLYILARPHLDLCFLILKTYPQA